MVFFIKVNNHNGLCKSFSFLLIWFFLCQKQVANHNSNPWTCVASSYNARLVEVLCNQGYSIWERKNKTSTYFDSILSWTINNNEDVWLANKLSVNNSLNDLSLCKLIWPLYSKKYFFTSFSALMKTYGEMIVDKSKVSKNCYLKRL